MSWDLEKEKFKVRFDNEGYIEISNRSPFVEEMFIKNSELNDLIDALQEFKEKFVD